MDPSRWEAVQALFDALIELSPSRRATKLASLGSADSELRDTVESLLAADAEVDTRLASLEAPFLSPAPAPDVLGLAGCTVSHFQVREPLGAGGMGVVYRAEDTRLGRAVALKFLLPHFGVDATAKSRFLREARSAAALDHPNLCTIHEIGEIEDGRLFFAMALYSGETLKARLERDGPLPTREALEIARQIAQGLACAHAAGIVHRDLKPGNVMLLPDGTVKILDFGLAQAQDESQSGTSGRWGTAPYMAPEQVLGEAVDARTDLWALGVVLYEMLTGRRPFGEGQEPGLAHAILAEEPVPPTKLAVNVPAQLERVILKLLEKEPSQRLANAGAALDALASPVGARQSWPRSRALRRRWVWAAPATLLVAIGAVTLWKVIPRLRVAARALSPNRVAVFPLTVQGSLGNEAVGEAVMDLLGSALDGVGDLRRVDPVAVVGALQRAKASVVDPASGARMAEQLGAGRYVVGTIIPLGGQLRVTASIYDAARQGDPVGQSTQQGAEEDLAALVEAVAADLVGHLSLGASARLRNVTGVRAANYPALKAYLEAERYLRRGADDSAETLLLRAVGLDSTFALAWYRLAWAQDFTFDYRMAQSADRAYGLRDRLSPRDQLLAAVTQAYGHAEAARAESLALVAVGTYPDDAEAWWLLGVLRMWDHWRWGRSPLEGLEPFERALALDPVQRQSRWNAAWLLFYQGSYNRADSLIQRSLALGVQTGIVGELDLEQVESRVTKAFTGGSTAEQRALLAELATRNDAILTRLGSYLTRFTDSLAGAEQLLRLLLDSVRRAPAVRAQAHLLIGTVQLAGGRWSAAQEETARAKAAGEVGLASVQRAYFAAVPFLALPVDEVLATRDSLRYWPTESTPEARPEDPGTWAKWYPPPELRPHLAAYLRGLLSARAGDTADARVQADRLERAREPGDSARLLPDLALEIRALAAAEGGRDSEALALLERMTMRTTWHYQQYASFAHLRPLARYLRGEVLYRLGRYHEALGWYWFGVLGRPEIVFQGPGFLRRGEIYEKLGDPTQAVREYRRFVARWRRSDPRYQSLVRDVDERIARLSQ